MRSLLTAEAVLHERHAANAQRQRLLRRASVPSCAMATDWPFFWDKINRILKDCGYAQSTRLQFRQVLRGLRRAGIRRPADISRSSVRRLMNDLVRSGSSWSWIALHMGVLRTVFDRLCGKSVTAGLVTPKRGQRLPEILGEREAEQLVQSGQTIRDQLLLGLLYGCGLAGSEAVNLRWRDVLQDGRLLHVAPSTRYMERVLEVPEPFHALVRAGKAACEPDDYVFRGRSEGTHLSTRAVELVVRRACDHAKIARPVCVMTLRHSYAVHRLESGVSLRQVQAELGHASIRTTERYQRCLAPKLDSHPFSKVRELMRNAVPATLERTSPAPGGYTPVGRGSLPASGAVLAEPRPSGLPPLSNMHSIDVDTLSLPFPGEEAPAPAAAFLRLLKTRLLSGLLRRKRSRSP